MSHRWQLITAFALVYLVWGSTYLGIRIGVRDLPPLLFAGVRFLIAGPLMLLYASSRRMRWPRRAHEWRLIGVTAVLMLVLGNGLVTWSERWVESNQAALIVATSAIWMAGFGALGAQADKVSRLTLLGLISGFAGVALLVGVGLSHRSAPWSAYLALLLAPMAWCAGSVYAKRTKVECSPWIVAGLQMLITGVILSALGLAAGEAARWQPTFDSIAALLYLAIFGSCLAYGAYMWLVYQVSPSLLGTYAYVNPAVAVLLGWWWLGETMNTMQIIGTGVILFSVMGVTLTTRNQKGR
ncbi:EamA family transporter [Sinimarinibacterium sp. NLF-5-8]|uniref:EamA family transporter n=1 Tax=Sinimarinibacterium sp. NLF-5-8 TaxID=2698684 RepID=UPI00137C3225|nr:EamA family transporter [Sinimarinibacterium sp. NLF-5-8]QHS11163.1 EamA family transporter [Sinimarinibacterium sp. NLF-5-8]